jgi:hypothetical protein
MWVGRRLRSLTDTSDQWVLVPFFQIAACEDQAQIPVLSWKTEDYKHFSAYRRNVFRKQQHIKNTVATCGSN